MTRPMSAFAQVADTAPHAIEGHEPRAARTTEGASRPAPSVTLSETARMLLEAAVLFGVLVNVAIWSTVISGRV